QSYNRCSYVIDNPLAYVDPSGHEEVETIIVTAQRLVQQDGWSESDVRAFERSMFGDFSGDPRGGQERAEKGKESKTVCRATQAVSFVHAHQADAATVAQQLGLPTQYVLGLSGIESQWGTSNPARSANNFFG